MIFPVPQRFFWAGDGWSAGVGWGWCYGNSGLRLGILIEYRYLFLYGMRHHVIFGERDMAFQSNGLRDAFEGQGEPGFMVWTYASFDPLEAIMEPGYFTGMSRFRVGDLVYVGTSPRPADSPWTRLQTSREIRRALLMIKGRDARGRMQVRLVQDYGGPDDGAGLNDGAGLMVGGEAPLDSPAASPRRGRGRPRKEMS